MATSSRWNVRPVRGRWLNLVEVAHELESRLVELFMPDANGSRRASANDHRYADDANFKRLLQFFEYFHGDTGRGSARAIRPAGHRWSPGALMISREALQEKMIALAYVRHPRVSYRKRLQECRMNNRWIRLARRRFLLGLLCACAGRRARARRRHARSSAT